MEEISILPVYCQVLCDKKKREDVFDYFRNKKYNIYCLQDTHFTPNEENAIEVLWGYKFFHSTQTSNSRGVSILFNNNFEFKVLKEKKRHGRQLCWIKCCYRKSQTYSYLSLWTKY